jgi:hypothetical protein
VADGGFFKSIMDYIDDVRKTAVYGTKGRRKATEDADKAIDDPSYDPNASKASDGTKDEEKKDIPPTTTSGLGFKQRMQA